MVVVRDMMVCSEWHEDTHAPPTSFDRAHITWSLLALMTFSLCSGCSSHTHSSQNTLFHFERLDHSLTLVWLNKRKERDSQICDEQTYAQIKERFGRTRSSNVPDFFSFFSLARVLFLFWHIHTDTQAHRHRASPDTPNWRKLFCSESRNRISVSAKR